MTFFFGDALTKFLKYLSISSGFHLVQKYKVSVLTITAELRFTAEQRTFINYMFIKFSHVKVTQRVQMIQQIFSGKFE